MKFVIKILRKGIILFCVALFFAGAVWNLYGTVTKTAEDVIQEETIKKEIAQKAVDVVFLEEDQKAENEWQGQDTETLERRIAALRIDRDASYQQLYHTLEQQAVEDKIQVLQKYAELQYKEHRLELLLSAKGVGPCLAVLELEQANIIVPESVLQVEYEKLYDIVLRNTEYAEHQIILIPAK